MNALFLLLGFVLLGQISCFKGCQPFGPRVFYGESIRDPSQAADKLVVHFNTAEPCLRSYLQLLLNKALVKVSCETTTLSLSKATNHYQTYIHKCRTDIVNYEQTFHYMPFGWDQSGSPVPYPEFVETTLADPFNKQRKMQWLVIGDWSKLEKNLDRYTPIDSLVQQTRRQQEINGLLILGDIGYDLDTNNCQNYQKFIVMTAELAAGLPLVMVTGNHEYNSQDNWKLYVNSFELYGLDTQYVTGLSLGSLYLSIFDPYQLLYSTQPIEDKVAPLFNKALDKAVNQGQFVLPTSHYPLACSGTSKNCKKDRIYLKAYWDSILSHKLSFYLGCHWHSYQRLYPYVSGDNFTTQADNYRSDGDYLISILEGVGGNDKDIVQNIDTIEKFTAAYTVNETGFGVLQIDTQNLVYRHLSTKQGEMDRVNIQIVSTDSRKKKQADNFLTSQ